MQQTALIAGGGIGGLAAALALSRVGYAVKLFEARPDPAEAGAGIQIGANGVKALRWIGVEAAALAAASKPEMLELKVARSGFLVARIPLGAYHLGRYGAPYLHLHRADLHAVLSEAALADSNIEVRRASRVVRAGQTTTHADVVLEDGTEVRGDVVIGADGIHSTLREGVAGKDSPRFTGMVAWRALVPVSGDAANTPRRATVWMGPARHLVQYPVRDGHLINLVGVVERDDWTSESWTASGDPAEFAKDFEGWSPELDRLLGRVETAWRWALYERPPLSVWSAGRLALLGDACHAMPPFLAQGASMALEDAVVLARRLAAGPDDPVHALRDYGAARHERTQRVQQASWANAWRFHLRQRTMRLAVHGGLAVLSRLAPSRPAHMFDWLYSYDPETA